MTTYEKLVKGATKIKMAPPKEKYVEPILMGTNDPQFFQEIVRALYNRVSDSAWTIVYKSLIVIHLLIKEGEKDVAIKYFSKNLDYFQLRGIQTTKFSSADLKALDRYNAYLKLRCQEYANFKVDYVRDGYSSLKMILNDNTENIHIALDHVESLEFQITALIKNKYSQVDLNNDLLMYVFKLLTQDLLALYNALNEGIITLLESFFELSRNDAERTLNLYKSFVDLTENVVKYLKIGKSLGLKIPVIKHITTKLIRSLEEHLQEDTVNVNNGGTSAFNNANTRSTGNDNNNNNEQRLLAQQKLEQIREQKKFLEQQLQNQQVLVSPTIPQNTNSVYNPFGATNTEAFTFETPQQVSQQQAAQVIAVPVQIAQIQPTGNPFLQQAPANVGMVANANAQQLLQQPQTTGYMQLPQATSYMQQPQTTGYIHQAVTPNLANQQTSFFASQLQVPPSFTGAGFDGYSNNNNNTIQQSQTLTSPIMSSETGSNNPFSVNNVHKELAMTATSNPFQNTGAANNVQTPALMMSGSFAAQPAPTGNFQPGYTGMGMMQMSPTGFHPFQPQHAPTQMQLQQQAQAQAQQQAQMQQAQLQQAQLQQAQMQQAQLQQQVQLQQQQQSIYGQQVTNLIDI